MNDPIFSQMKEQLIPSPAARAALEEGLSRPVRRPVHRCRYWVLAACLLLAAALPLGHALLFPPLHSYVTVGKRRGRNRTPVPREAAPAPASSSARADLDRTPPPQRRGSRTTSAGFPPPPRTASALPSSCPGRREDLFRCRHRRGRPAPGAPDSGDPTEYGNGTYPDWYGGGYLDSAGDVVVLLVRGCDTQALRSQVGTGPGAGCPLPGPATPSPPHQAPGADLCPALSEGGAVLLRPGRGEQPSGPVPHQGRR